MAEVGKLTWLAEFQQIAEAKQGAREMTEGLEGAGEQARQTDAVMEDVDESGRSLGARFGGLGRRSSLLSGALGLLNSGFLLLVGTMGFATGAITKFTTAIKALTGWLLAGGLTGAVGTVLGALRGLGLWVAGGLLAGFQTLVGWGAAFITWLAAGSAGALAFAAALGGLIGLAGVFILEWSGALDVIKGFGRWVGEVLPQWVGDAMLALISLFLGPLAVIGAAIAGFVEGFLEGGLAAGVDQAVARVQQMLGIFSGAWSRTLARIISLVTGFGQSLIDAFVWAVRETISWFQHLAQRLIGGSIITDMLSNIVSAVLNWDIAEAFKSALGAALSTVKNIVGDITSAVGGAVSAVQGVGETAAGMAGGLGGSGGRLGGQTENNLLPGLQSGGFIEETGAMIGHAGEMVIPAAVTDRLRGSGGGGSGGGGGGETTVVKIERQVIEIGDQSIDVSNLDRRTLETLADLIAEKQGDELTAMV